MCVKLFALTLFLTNYVLAAAMVWVAVCAHFGRSIPESALFLPLTNILLLPSLRSAMPGVPDFGEHISCYGALVRDLRLNLQVYSWTFLGTTQILSPYVPCSLLCSNGLNTNMATLQVVFSALCMFLKIIRARARTCDNVKDDVERSRAPSEPHPIYSRHPTFVAARRGTVNKAPKTIKLEQQSNPSTAQANGPRLDAQAHDDRKVL